MTQRRRRVLLLAAVVLSLVLATIAHATSTGWIFLGGPIADQGVGVAPLGEVDIAIAGNHTVTTTEFRGASIQVTGSLSGTAALTVPLESGAWKVVTNNTTGGFSITWGGASGTAVTIPAGQTFDVNCPDGANWTSAGGGGGGSGGGFDAGAYSTPPGFLYYDAGSLVWRNLSATDIPAINLAGGSSIVTGTLPLGNGGTGVTSSGSSGNVLRSNGSVWASSAIQSGDLTSALASPPAIGGTTPAAGTFSTITGRSGTRYRDAGGSTVEFPSECGGVGTTTNGPVDSCTFLATFTDATTWVNLMPTGFLIANRTSATFDLEYSITDQTDAPDAGPVDLQVGQFRFTATASNGGGITVFDEIGGSASSSSLTIAAAPTSKSYISGVAGAVVPACRVVVTGSYLQPQCQGRTSKTDVGQFTMQNARGLQ